MALKKWFGYWLVSSALAASIVLLPLLCWANTDVLYVFFIGPLVLAVSALIMLTFAAFRKTRRHFLRVLAMLAIFWLVSLLLVKNSFLIRTSARWLVRSQGYKMELLSQADPANGELRHIEWEATGFAGADETVYLVFDPKDSLAAAAKSHSAGKFDGIPCKVRSVTRLESHWYTVLFYTDEAWGKPKQDCGFYGLLNDAFIPTIPSRRS
jgi:hypothetical protein